MFLLPVHFANTKIQSKAPFSPASEGSIPWLPMWWVPDMILELDRPICKVCSLNPDPICYRILLLLVVDDGLKCFIKCDMVWQQGDKKYPLPLTPVLCLSCHLPKMVGWDHHFNLGDNTTSLYSCGDSPWSPMGQILLGDHMSSISQENPVFF